MGLVRRHVVAPAAPPLGQARRRRAQQRPQRRAEAETSAISVLLFNYRVTGQVGKNLLLT